jgi:hypothetical protein
MPNLEENKKNVDLKKSEPEIYGRKSGLFPVF